MECAPAEVLDSICTPMLTAGKSVLVLSAGALLPRPRLMDLARQHGGDVTFVRPVDGPTRFVLSLPRLAAPASQAAA